MKYNFKKIEKKWKLKHKKINFFKINKKSKKKFYILNMIPYPSGYGLHVGHSIGYIFSDIIAKYKLRCGYKILNPIGFDSFGLPAEQFAIKTGKHPEIIIKKSIKNYIKQIKNLGIFLDLKNIINTCNSNYYKWTQYIFIKLFNSWYDNKNKKAKNIKILIKKLKKEKKWEKYNNKKKNKILNKYRLVFLKKSFVNWCPYLKTVLSNDEIYNNKSIRGGYKIIKKKMLQWHIRITKYLDRLLNDIKYLKWSKNIINSQKKWIGKKKVFLIKIKSNVGYIKLYIKKKKKNIKNIIIMAPSYNINFFLKNIKKKYKNEFIKKINKLYNNEEIKILIKTNLLNNKNKKINIYISNYFKNKYIKGVYILKKKNNNFLNKKNNLIYFLNKHFNIKKIKILKKIKKKIIFNLNDIVFSRQRYWGEPIPIYYKYNIPFNIKKKYLPLKLPNINNKILKLKNINKWAWDIKKNKIINKSKNSYLLDINTMPSFAGSNWYYLRFIDNKNKKKIISNKKEKFWKTVDLYIGGSEHINGHLLYSRFCYKFLKDIKIVNFKEPFKKFINQGLILYYSFSIFRLYKYKKFISYDLIKNYKKNNLIKIYIKNEFIINKNELNIKLFIKKNNEYKKFFFKKKKEFLCLMKIEKMSKSKLNIINPNSIIKKYGIDVFRLYQMFIGPFNKKKIWNIEKIKGIYKFINKIWNYFNNLNIINKKLNYKENILINNFIYKINNNLKFFNLNVSISNFMKFFNKIKKKKKIKIKILKIFLILFSSFSPYISEELWFLIKNKKSIFFEKIPKINKEFINLKIKYLLMFNNKLKNVFYIKKEKNKKKYIINKYLKKINKKKIKKIIFKKNKILNILF
ncbi:MAG: class I tRNA ligase family protein [Candidatus Shikimatogenerans bostrichidophilus]|nr:MAG: class I tRNA ligase family protein [Candidatus Shikimatogenerans bostrichidophilus]